MVQIQPTAPSEVIYPDSDGNPMSDNTKQFSWIVKIKENIELLYADDPNVFVAGDLLWYPVEGKNTIRQAPDVMVAIGRPKGYRGSYQQWKEGNISPQVMFEILSPGNRMGEMNRKFRFYEQYGVEEYYVYDPDREDFNAWIRVNDRLESMDFKNSFVSPLLGIRFELEDNSTLVIYGTDGQPFLDFVDNARLRQDAIDRAELEKNRANQEKNRANEAENRAELEKNRATLAETQAQKLATKLRELGINPDVL